MSNEVQIGVIGGSGLYEIEGLVIKKKVNITTPFGDPSDGYIIGEFDGVEVAFLPRHGRHHTLLPGELNFPANIYGFKTLGVERLISVSAVGSLKEELVPTHVVLPDQFVDRTRNRPDTFFGHGMVAHVSLAHPVCDDLAGKIAEGAEKAGAVIHRGGTYLCMEGPQFSTKAESLLYRSWGMDVIGMTNLQEAKLAREAEMCYATMAMVTDYDCWHEGSEDVTGMAVLEVIRTNVRMAQEIVRHTVGLLSRKRTCACSTALDAAIVTNLDNVDPKRLDELDPILTRYRSRQT